MKNLKLIRFYTHGGFVSPADMRSIALFAIKNGLEHIHLGIRQDVIIKLNENISEKDLERSLKSVSIPYEISYDFNSKNIGSSLLALDLFPTTVWLKSDVYFDILAAIKETPKLKVNITDPVQGLVSPFKGNLNFIASKIPGFWYLSIELPWDRNRTFWPNYVASDDIPKMIKSIEESLAYKSQLTIDALILETSPAFKNILPPIGEVPVFRKRRFPNYDGLHKYGDDKYWVGLFDRENNYSARFLEELALLCTREKAGSLFITPWNSIIIKGLKRSSLNEADKIFGKFSINVQHSSVELNWQIPSLDYSAMKLKKYITRVFNKLDVRTYGLTFGIRTRPVFISTSVIIRKEKNRKLSGRNYNILYSKSFNFNNNDFIRFGSTFTKRQLPGALMQICELYNQSLVDSESVQNAAVDNAAENESEANLKTIHECSECMTVYDPDHIEGDDVPSFWSLPETWKCPVCEANKSAYKAKQVEINDTVLI